MTPNDIEALVNDTQIMIDAATQLNMIKTKTNKPYKNANIMISHGSIVNEEKKEVYFLPLNVTIPEMTKILKMKEKSCQKYKRVVRNNFRHY